MKKILIILLFLFALGGGAAWYFYNQPVADLAEMDSDFSLSAKELFDAFKEDEMKANEKYLDKVIQVKGTVSTITEDDDGNTSMVLDTGDGMEGVVCQMAQSDPSVRSGAEISIKGRCTGYLMMSGVILVGCVPL